MKSQANKFFDKPIVLGIRAEDIHDDEVVMAAYPDGVLNIKVDVAELLGADPIFTPTLIPDKDKRNVIAKVNARTNIHIGDTIN